MSGMTLFERAVNVVSPTRAVSMARSRFAVEFAGQYAGARRDKTSLRNFNPMPGSADADSIGDLPTLRSRSRDLGRNAPIARGARNTSKTNVVGSGLRLTAKVDAEILGLTEDQAEAWEAKAEALFHLWAKAKTADVARRLNFYQMQAVAFTSAWDSGDMFAIRRYKEGASFVALCSNCLRPIASRRRSTPKRNEPSRRRRARRRRRGYRLSRPKPSPWRQSARAEPRSGRLGAHSQARQNRPADHVIHLLDVDRIGQTRGVPALAPVIERSSNWTATRRRSSWPPSCRPFSPSLSRRPATGARVDGVDNVDGVNSSGELALGSGTIIELAPDESVETANPNRPNANFDPFFLAVIRQIGIALGIPYEVLIMHFSSSYTASKAAIETARQFFHATAAIGLRRIFVSRHTSGFSMRPSLAARIKAPTASSTIRSSAPPGRARIGSAARRSCSTPSKTRTPPKSGSTSASRRSSPSRPRRPAELEAQSRAARARVRDPRRLGNQAGRAGSGKAGARSRRRQWRRLDQMKFSRARRGA
jgi:capsid protein